MHISKFERLVLLLGASIVFATLAFTFTGNGPETAESVALIMLFIVLAVAVRYGRRGGLVAAVIASGVYILMRAPLLSSGPLSPAALTMVLAQLAAFGLVGIVGGELCARINYLIADLNDGSAIDEWSRVYNQKHAAASLTRALARFTRYGEEFSLLVVTLSDAVFADYSPAAKRKIIRGLANHIRTDVRVVDEVARLDDGRFAVMLPHTPKAGGEVVRARLTGGLQSALGSRDNTVKVVCLSVPDDDVSLTSLLAQIAPQDQEASGE